MSNSLAFDTHAYVKKLTSVGFTEEQAEAQAEAFSDIVDERLVTKQDISLLKRDIKELEISLKRDMKELDMRLTIKLGTMFTSGIIIVAALVKLL